MAQKIYLHVGSPKTGTTFLQQVLWSQRAIAESQGLQLPGERFNDHFLATLDVRGVAGPPHPDESVGAWNRLTDDARRRGGTVLISTSCSPRPTRTRRTKRSAGSAPTSRCTSCSPPVTTCARSPRSAYEQNY